MQKIVIFSLMIILCPLTGFGEVCQGYKNITFVNYSNNGSAPQYPDYNCNDFIKFDEWIYPVLALSPVAVKNINIIANKNPSYDASMDDKFFHLTIGFDKSNFRSDAIHTVFVHELGHAILVEYLKEIFPELRELKDLQDELAIAMPPFFGYVHLLSNEGKCVSEQCHNYVKSVGEDAINRPQTISKQINSWKNSHQGFADVYFSVIMPYHELFADAVTVLSNGRPNSVEQAINTLVGIDQKCRGFNYSSKLVETLDTHCAFSGVRAMLLAKVIQPAIDKNQQANAVKMLLQIFSDEIFKQVQAGVKDPDWTFNPQSAFEHLVSRIETL